MKMLLLFSHKLTQEQIRDAERMGIKSFISLPEDLQKKWSNVPAEIENLDEYIKAFYDFVEAEAIAGDYVLIQGDFGMCCKMAGFCKQKGLVPVYATTKRVAKEIKKGDKVVKISEFKHIRYRKYE